MSILIKGMEMPKSCFYCPFRRKINPDDIQCLVTRDVFEETFAGTIEMRNRGFCPLIPVPPHGRLIDVNTLWVEINKICDRRDAGIITDLTCLQQILSALRHAPTIIPTEEGKR